MATSELKQSSGKQGVMSCLVAAVLVPLAVISLFWSYVGSTHAPNDQPSSSATPAFLVAIACGGFFLWRLPVRWPFRLLCLLIYVPVAYVALFFYTLFFLAVVFHFAIT